MTALSYHLIFLIYQDSEINVDQQVQDLQAGLGIRFRSIAIINNKNTRSFANPRVISGDNSARDFSGYEVGLCEIEKGSYEEGDQLIVANDTLFFKHSAKNVMRLMRRALLISSDASLLGWKDVSRREIHNSLKGAQMLWISSYLFRIPLTTAIRHRLCPNQLRSEHLFDTSNIDNFFRMTVPAGVQVYLKKSVMTRDQGWMGSQDLNKENAVTLAGKASAILCETNLTQSAIADGLEIVGINTSKDLKSTALVAVCNVVHWVLAVRSIGAAYYFRRHTRLVKKLSSKISQSIARNV